MKGIILAGGRGSRLRPLTLVASKQILPVYDKPMIYYPLSVLMLAGVTDIEIISSPADLPGFRRLLGDGSRLGLSFTYAEQDEPRGIADAFIVSADHIGDDSVALVLGDNIFYGADLGYMLRRTIRDEKGCTMFGYPVRDPGRYGVAEVDECGSVVSLAEKPSAPRSNLAVTGLFMYDNDVVEIARNLPPSERGELEITDVNRVYLERGKARLVPLGRGFVWFDAGTHDSLIQASQCVQMLEKRQGVRIGCIEEVAWRMGYIDRQSCKSLGEALVDSPYGKYIMDITCAGSEQVES